MKLADLIFQDRKFQDRRFTIICRNFFQQNFDVLLKSSHVYYQPFHCPRSFQHTFVSSQLNFISFTTMRFILEIFSAHVHFTPSIMSTIITKVAVSNSVFHYAYRQRLSVNHSYYLTTDIFLKQNDLHNAVFLYQVTVFFLP